MLLLLVDGHSIAFRAFHSFPDSIRDPQGEPVQIVYGFLAIVLRQVAALGADHLAVAWDVGRPIREAWFPDYKAGRQEPEPEVERQVARLQPVLAAMEVPTHAADGYEADDVIATLTRQAQAAPELHTVILSGDRDLWGLLGPQVTVLYPTRSMDEAERYDAARLYARWAIRPEQVADFKALVGDASDRIPGVRAIGEKGAAKLLAEWGTLEAIYANLAAVAPPRTRDALAAGRDSAFLSQRLARLIADVPGVTLDLAACRLAYDRAAVEAALDTLGGFKSLRSRLP